MLTALKARLRHRRLMRAAHDLLHDTNCYSTCKTANDITAQDLVTYVFGRHHDDLSTDEAQRYLDYARLNRGESTTQETTAVPTTAP